MKPVFSIKNRKNKRIITFSEVIQFFINLLNFIIMNQSKKFLTVVLLGLIAVCLTTNCQKDADLFPNVEAVELDSPVLKNGDLWNSLTTMITGQNLQKGIENSLIKLVEQANKSWDAGKTNVAINQLNAVIILLLHYIDAGLVTDDGQLLINKLTLLIDSLKGKVITDGLVAYYPFHGNAHDLAGGNDGTEVGGVSLTTDRFGNPNEAYSVDGVDDYIEAPNGDFTATTNVSVSLWFKVSSNDLIVLRFINCKDFAIYTDDYYSTHQAGMSVEIPGVGTRSAKGSYVYDEWTHLVGTYDGTDIKAYINGTLINTYNQPSETLGTWSSTLLMGVMADKITMWPGELDDVMIFDRVLNAEEVAFLYNVVN